MILKPFEQTKKQGYIIAGWAALVLLIWFLPRDKNLFPTPEQVWRGFTGLWNEGLMLHIGSSLFLCLQSVVLSLLVSLVVAYSSPIPMFKPLGQVFSKLRFLPLIGLTYYMAVLFTDARVMQIGVLVIFMSTYFITSLLALIRDIPAEEIDHAKSLRCSRWEILWEVVIKGRIDMVLDVLRQNLAIVWMMLVTVESILVASGGIGVLIKNSDKMGNHGRVVALQIVILLIGLFLDWSISYIRKHTFRYS